MQYASAPVGSRAAVLLRRLGEKAGGVYEQGRMLRPHDVVLSGTAQTVRGIAMARHRGAWPKPIVAVFHNDVPQRGRAVNAWVNGVDVALCLTSAAHRSLVDDHGRDPERTFLVRWGPDLGFSGYTPTGHDFVACTGKDNRDVGTLLEALADVRCAAKVYAPAGTQSPSPEIEIVSPTPDRPHFEFSEVLGDLQAASLVAIPIARLDRLTGLTELNDALALGKPVVMTRTSGHLDNLDIEKAGFGVYVEPGNVEQWREVLSNLTAQPERLEAMGRAARNFAETEWNYAEYCAVLDRALQIAIGSPVLRPEGR
ncbi:MAG: hypothetical protein Q7T55_17350 [Solirubrobacteraceae bacterium]|nr:hypothetical protein [Solirubrobacteraceae bacterium]